MARDDPADRRCRQAMADVAEPGHRHEDPGGEDGEHDGRDDALAKLPCAPSSGLDLGLDRRRGRDHDVGRS